MADNNKMTIIATKGTYDWGYPPFILASTAVAMDKEVTIFFIKKNTFSSNKKELKMADETLDASGLNCPLPILKTKKALAKMEAGQVLEVISTDAGSVKDIEAFCNQTGNKLISNAEDAGKYLFTIEKV